MIILAVSMIIYLVDDGRKSWIALPGGLSKQINGGVRSYPGGARS